MSSDLDNLLRALERASAELPLEDVLELMIRLDGIRSTAHFRFLDSLRTVRSGEDEVLDIAQAAKLLNLPDSRVEEGARRGEIPSFKEGHYRRFLKSKLWEHLKKQSEIAERSIFTATGGPRYGGRGRTRA